MTKFSEAVEITKAGTAEQIRSAMYDLVNGPYSTATCSFCGASCEWLRYGISWGGWGNGPYRDYGPRPSAFAVDGIVTISVAGGHWGENDCQSRAVVVESASLDKWGCLKSA